MLPKRIRSFLASELFLIDPINTAQIANGTQFQRSGKTLSIVLTKNQAQRYKDSCLPRLWDRVTAAFPLSNDATHENVSEDLGRDGIPQQMPTRESNESGQNDIMLPLGNTDANPTSESSTAGGIIARLFQRSQIGPPRPDPQDSMAVPWDIHCCIDRIYTESLETILRHIDHNGLDDEKFLNAFNKEIQLSAGNWFWGTLRRTCSWKRCCSISFVEVFSTALKTRSLGAY